MNGYVVLCVVYSFALTMSNIMAGKFMSLGALNLPSATVIFPIVYIASDLMTEIYGIRRSLFAIRLNTCVAALFALFSWVLLKLPSASFWQNQSAFEAVFASTPRVILASLVGYYTGDWLNSVSLSLMKIKQGGRFFAVRSIVSSLIGEAIDSIAFFVIAFYGVLPLEIMLQSICWQYVFKVSYEVVCLPLTCAVVRFWKRHVREVFDTGKLNEYI